MSGSKVSQGFPAKGVSGHAVVFGGGEKIDGADFLGEVIRKVIREVVRVKR